MTTDREPTEYSESEIRSLSPTFQYLDSFYSDKNGSSLILFCDEGSYPDSSLNSSKTSTSTVKPPVSPFPLVLDNSCCNQPSESSLQLFYKDTPNSSIHPFCTDSPIRPTISPTPPDSEAELSSSLSTAFDAIGGSWETTIDTANDGIFCSTPKPSAVRIHAKRRRLIDILPSELQCSFSDVDTSEAEILASSTSGSASRSLSQMLANSCCESRCLAHLSIVQVEHAREKFQCRTTVEQNQFILDSFQVTGEKKISQTSAVMLEGQLICRDAFISALGISRKRYQNLLHQFLEGVTQFSRKRISRTEATKVAEAKAWMTYFFNRIGDHMPHVQKVHLPHFLTKKDIYFRMKTELVEEGLQEKDIISLSYFYKLWEKFFKDVIPAQNRFSKCDLCTKYGQERMKPGRAKTPAFQAQYQQHLSIVEQERKKYYLHREKSRAHPEKYLTIIIDGMDQSKTNVPLLLKEAKSAQHLYRLRTHLTGAIIHTRSPHGKIIYAFYDIMQWPHDSNLILQVLNDILHDFKTKLPDTLYLQLDNCYRENKNRYVLGYCALLVQKKVFKKVRVNFLPVGHTHEDIDQFFSKVSHRLNKKGAETFEDLQKETTLSTTPEPIVVVLREIRDIKAWIKSSLEDIHGHSTPHCFKFQNNAKGEVIMFSKNWSSNPWCNEQDAVKLLKSVPIGVPHAVSPNLEKLDLNRLKEDIPKFRPWILSSSAAVWNTFMAKDLEDYLSTRENGDEWIMQDVFQREHPPPSESTSSREDNQELAAMFAAEQESCQVYTGAYRTRRQNIVEVKDMSELAEGHLVAVECENCSSEPLLARIVKVFDTNIEVVWLDGEYDKPWKVARHRDPQNRRKMVDWKDILPKSCIILFDFQLTSTKHLRKATIEHLKKAYSDLRNERT